MATILKNTTFTRVTSGVKPDTKRRIVLPKALADEEVTYHIYSNEQGQILLDPQVTIPASEAWLFRNPKALSLVRQGLADAAKGKVLKIELEDL